MIRDSYELANTLGAVFSRYANQVLNGDIQPYEALYSQDSVDVVFTVTAEGGLSVKPLVQEKPKVATEDELSTTEIADVEASVKEIQEGKTETFGTVDELLTDLKSVEEKPKRSRKKKEPEEVTS